MDTFTYCYDENGELVCVILYVDGVRHCTSDIRDEFKSLCIVTSKGTAGDLLYDSVTSNIDAGSYTKQTAKQECVQHHDKGVGYTYTYVKKIDNVSQL